jgi:hypothetical protein
VTTPKLRPCAVSLLLDRWAKPMGTSDGGMSAAARRVAGRAITALRGMGLTVKAKPAAGRHLDTS